MTYLVDANVLIEAKNRYYAFDIAPGFWDWLNRAYCEGLVCSVDKVGEELTRGDDELAQWASDHQDFFRPVDESTVQYFPELSTWAYSRSYIPAALNDFTADAADYVLVAYAAAHACTLVTHETPDANSRKRVKIPDACRALDVVWMNPFEMLRRTHAKLLLAEI